MRKLSGFLVDRRRPVFAFMMALMILSAALIPRVRVNTDMTKYLPESSPMKQGVDIMAEEFSGLAVPNTVRVMFHDVPEEEKAVLLEELKETPHVESVSFIPGDERYEKDGYVLYILSFSIGFFSQEMKETESFLKANFDGRYEMTYVLDKTNQQGIPAWIFALALALLILILVIMSGSYAEPFLFLFSMGAAVIINMGTNVLLPEVSEITYSIAAILQLALSVDYSVMLMGRYRQELESTPVREDAMKEALGKAFSSIAGSAFTTIVGLLVLILMSFTIGRDMGIVLAKGVFLSMISTFTVLPFLIITFDRLLKRTAKKIFSPRMDGLGRFSYRFRRVIAVFFAVFFVLMYVLKGSTGIAFTLIAPNEIDPIFPKENQIVVLYENADEENAAAMIPLLETDEAVNSVTAWGNTFGKAFTAEELAEFMSSMNMDFALSPEMLKMVYSGYFGGEEGGRLTLQELITYASESFGEGSLLGSFLSDEMKETLAEAPSMLEEGEKQLKGGAHSMMAISTSLPGESEETAAFMERLTELCEEHFTGNYYLIGNTPMAYEMVKTFSGELNLLTILTAAAIFLVVVCTFRSIAVPVILVLLIQSAVYATMVMMNLQGMTIYYIALLVVQSILMGATIDYAIVFTTYYREARRELGGCQALIASYNHSIHTILTSGLIMVSVTAVVGFAFADPSVQQIVHTISKGAACAILLILFVLPGVLAALDRFVVTKEVRNRK